MRRALRWLSEPYSSTQVVGWLAAVISVFSLHQSAVYALVILWASYTALLAWKAAKLAKAAKHWKAEEQKTFALYAEATIRAVRLHNQIKYGHLYAQKEEAK